MPGKEDAARRGEQLPLPAVAGGVDEAKAARYAARFAILRQLPRKPHPGALLPMTPGCAGCLQTHSRSKSGAPGHRCKGCLRREGETAAALAAAIPGRSPRAVAFAAGLTPKRLKRLVAASPALAAAVALAAELPAVYVPRTPGCANCGQTNPARQCRRCERKAAAPPPADVPAPPPPVEGCRWCAQTTSPPRACRSCQAGNPPPSRAEPLAPYDSTNRVPRRVPPHGTLKGWTHHRTTDRDPCRPCMDARNRADRRRKAGRGLTANRRRPLPSPRPGGWSVRGLAAYMGVDRRTVQRHRERWPTCSISLLLTPSKEPHDAEA